MAKDLSVNISLKDSDIFNGLLKIIQDILEDGRVPIDVKHKIRSRVKELTDKEEKNNG